VDAAVVLAGEIAFRVLDRDADLAEHARLRATLDALAVPATFEHTGDDPARWSAGAGGCACTRRWLAPGSTEEVQAGATSAVTGAGFALGPWETVASGARLAFGRRGDLHVVLALDPTWAWCGGRPVALTAGRVEVTAMVHADGSDE
jgi:hypothetical protein